MNKIPVLCCFVLIAQVLSMALSTQYVKAQNDTPENPGDFVPGEIVVAFKSGKTTSQYAAAAAEIAKKTHTRPVKVGAGGVALLRGDSGVDVVRMAKSINSGADVLYAEPNYIFKLPEVNNHTDEISQLGANYLQKNYTIRKKMQVDKFGEKIDEVMLEAVPFSQLQSMNTQNGSTIQATYPNDPNLWWNSGWDVVDADVVSSNTTSSAGVCLLDTGVDYLHPDLSGKILKGYDFVNGDANPMDDSGHGTHVAGIITAKPNNAIGLAGASRAMVVAVKVLTAQGWGTNFDIAAGITYCANRTDVRILNMSLSGAFSQAIYDAVYYAVTTRGKLVIAAAGNENTEDFTNAYPAYLAASAEFDGKVLAAAASGKWVDVDDLGFSYTYSDYDCRSDYSNYGDWVSLVAPGSDIYSTTPYDKPFYMNYYYGASPRYGYMGGTSSAAAFVSAAASRRWGYKPLETNVQIGYDLVNSGEEINNDDICWPLSMAGKHQVNIANLLNRFATEASILDANAGVGLTGAAIQLYKGTTLLGSAVMPPFVSTYSLTYSSSTGKFTQTGTRDYRDTYTTIINIPVPTNGEEFWDIWHNGYTYKASKSGYTAAPQPVWQHVQKVTYNAATLFLDDQAAIPPRSSNIDVVLGHTVNLQYDQFAGVPWMGVDVWLPAVPNPRDASQPAPFVVGHEGNSMGFLENDPMGSMNVFPFARLKQDHGYFSDFTFKNITISSRKAHGPLPANSNLPYYPGDYVVGVTDTGIAFDPTETGSPMIPQLGALFVPYVYIWKDGYIRLVNVMPPQNALDACNAHWWRAATITSGVSGSITYTPNYDCSNTTDIFPYSNSTP